VNVENHFAAWDAAGVGPGAGAVSEWQIVACMGWNTAGVCNILVY